MSCIDRLNAYIKRDHESVKGWLSPPDMVMMACAGLAQQQLSVPGDVCEIGVFNGKSLILLSHLMRDGDRGFGIDYFEGNTREETSHNLIRYASHPDSISLHKSNTLDLAPGSLEALLPGQGSLRYLHVDGGHEYFEVLHDLMLFAPFLRLDGILVLDDYHDREYPGVNLAIEHFCGLDRSGQGFVPFMEGLNKLFLCRKDVARHYQTALVGNPTINAGMRVAQGPGHEILVPFSRYPMPVDDMVKVIDAPARFLLTPNTKLEEVNRLARARGSDGMVKSMTRAGKRTEDFL